MTEKCFIGVDPGLAGGICLVHEDLILECIPMPVIKMKTKRELDIISVVEFMERAKKTLSAVPHVVIEAVGPMPKQGVTSMFNFGKGYGIILGVVAGLRYPVTLVRPAEWKRVMLKGMPAGKGSSIVRAKQLSPTFNFKASSRCTTYHDGMAEAYLIAQYGRRVMNGQ